jgi:hypothetical protein
MVEFLSRETRQPDAELLAMIEDFGRLFGRLLEHAKASGVRLVEQAGTVRPGTEEPAPGMVPDVFRDLAGAVAAATEVLERHSTVELPTGLTLKAVSRRTGSQRRRSAPGSIATGSCARGAPRAGTGSTVPRRSPALSRSSTSLGKEFGSAPP